MAESGEDGIFQRAAKKAVEFRHTIVTHEHLLLAMLEDDDSLTMMHKAGVDTAKLTRRLTAHLSGQQQPPGGRFSVDLSPEILKLIALVARNNRYMKLSDITGPDVIEGMLEQGNSKAATFLEDEGMTLSVARTVKSGSKASAPGTGSNGKESSKTVNGAHIIEPGKTMKQFCTNLNEEDANGKVDEVIGRIDEIDTMVEVLGRRRKNNPILVGDAGVGKTALGEGLAQRINRGEVPENLKKKNIFSLDMNALVAGTQYRGQFEDRLKKLMEELKDRPGAMLFIDEIHTIMGAGSASGSMDASNILKPALARGQIQLIGTTTVKEFKKFDKDPALKRRFERVDLEETSKEMTKKILHGLRPKYEDFHKVTYSDEVLEMAVLLAAKYVGSTKMPDSAITVIDQAGSAVKNSAAYAAGKKKAVTVEDIEAIVAKIARMPATNVSASDRKALKTLDADLKKAVFDQDEALDKLAEAIKLARAGLREPNKPIGSFLFPGPTGVGKTEAAKQLAKTLGVPLKRFDMSEYTEKHNVARLVGAPPGYVGHEDGGQLTDAVDQHPHSIVLLDEIEKAHPDIFNILLQVMDDGRLTDGTGKLVKFNNVILIMTTNAGSSDQVTGRIGLLNSDEGDAQRAHEEGAIQKLFRPEFRNRLDAVIPFNALKVSTMEKIVDKFVADMQEMLEERHVTLKLSPAARKYLAEKGYDPAMGARPLSRLIQDEIKKPLSEEILYGDLEKGGSADIGLKKDKDGEKSLSFKFNKSAAANDNNKKPENKADKKKKRRKGYGTNGPS